jgi:hypothetical protein
MVALALGSNPLEVVVDHVRLVDSMVQALGFTKVSTVPVKTPEEICCGDPSNLDGGAHPWAELGEDNRGTHYKCDVCGAYDVD